MKTFIFVFAISLVFLSCSNDTDQSDLPSSSSDVQLSSSSEHSSSSEIISLSSSSEHSSSSEIISSSSSPRYSSGGKIGYSSSISFEYSSSSSSYEFTEILPIWSSGAISYKRLLGVYEDRRFITDEDSLKLLFPNILNEGQRDGNCNYFAIIIPSSPSLEYFILSQDMVLYRIFPYYWSNNKDYKGECSVITTPASDAMLICDDTAEQNLKDKINLDYASMPRYIYPDWDCREEDEYDRGVFF